MIILIDCPVPLLLFFLLSHLFRRVRLAAVDLSDSVFSPPIAPLPVSALTSSALLSSAPRRTNDCCCCPVSSGPDDGAALVALYIKDSYHHKKEEGCDGLWLNLFVLVPSSSSSSSPSSVVVWCVVSCLCWYCCARVAEVE